MNVIAFFHESKQIVGICPCCRDVFRLSDAMLYTKERPPFTPIDALEADEAELSRAEKTFDKKEEMLRGKAVEKGQKAAKKQLEAIAGPFVQREIDPQDVKVIFHPVEFVAFRGMSNGLVDRVAFIDRPATSKDREKLQASIAKTIGAGNVDWRELRIGADGKVVEFAEKWRR